LVWADVVGISTTKHRASNIVQMIDGWKLFCSVVETAQFTQAGVLILVYPQVTNCVVEWIPLGGRVCVLDVEVVRPPLFLITPQTQMHCTVIPRKTSRSNVA